MDVVTLYAMVLCGAQALPCPPLLHADELKSFTYEREECVRLIRKVHAERPNYAGYCIRKDYAEIINETGQVTDLTSAANRWEPLAARSSKSAPAQP